MDPAFVSEQIQELGLGKIGLVQDCAQQAAVHVARVHRHGGHAALFRMPEIEVATF